MSLPTLPAAAGSDGLVGELLKYDGPGMVGLLEKLFSVIWHEEAVPRQSLRRQWREGLIVNLFKKGHRENSWNYRARGITLLSVVGKVLG